MKPTLVVLLYDRMIYSIIEVVTLSKQVGVMYKVHTLNWIRSRTPYGVIIVN